MVDSTFVGKCAILSWIHKFLSQVYTGLLKAYFATHAAYKEAKIVVSTKKADTAFEGLKKVFTSAPILAHVEPQKTIYHGGRRVSKATMRSYMPWLFTRANLTTPKSTMT